MYGEVHRALDAAEWNLEDLRSVLRQDASGINIPGGGGLEPVWRVLVDKKCSADIVQLLIDYGADISEEYLLPNFLESSSYKINPEVINVLVKAGACTTHDGISTLCYAFEYCLDDDIVKVLLEVGLMRICTQHSFLPLICATEHIEDRVRISVFRMLLEAGARPNVHSHYDGETPLHKVLGNHFYEPDDMVELIELLVGSGAQIDAVDNKGDIPLHTAVSYYHTTNIVVECLLKKGSPVVKRNGDGRTPLEVAVRNSGNQEIIELLFAAGSVLGVTRHSALEDAFKTPAVNDPFDENRFKTFLIYYFLEKEHSVVDGLEKSLPEVDGLKKALSEVDDLMKSSSEVDGWILEHDCLEELSCFAKVCVRELSEMETIRVCNGRYSLLECIRTFIREPIVNLNRKIFDCGIHLLKVLSDNEFPLYFEVILFKVKRFFNRKTLEQHLLYVEFNTSYMGRKIFLNYDSVRHFAKFLPTFDLLKFIYSFYNNDCLKQDIEFN